jgi:hypothetical protein
VRAKSDLKRTGVVRWCNEHWMICCEKVY